MNQHSSLKKEIMIKFLFQSLKKYNLSKNDRGETLLFLGGLKRTGGFNAPESELFELAALFLSEE